MQIYLTSSGIKSQHKFHRGQNNDYLQQKLQQIIYNTKKPLKFISLFIFIFVLT